MSTAHATALITAEQFAEMNLDGPYELVRGEIVEMTRPDKPHGSVCARVSLSLMQWALPIRQGEVITNDSCILTERDPDTMRGADVAFVPANLLRNGRLPRGNQSMGMIPTLCVEVLSRSNSWTEMHRKIEEYLAAGVHEVWLVDPELRTVERFRNDSGATLFRESQTLTSLELPGFSAPVADFFAGVE